jgi:prepilin-type N-terminal cleavage/methylation domain-containing protein
MKDKEKRVFRLLLKSLKPGNKKSGFTFLEVMLVAFIIAMLFTALFQVLNVGQLTNIASTERTYLQSEVRRAMDWIVRDVRQSLTDCPVGDGGINNNHPSDAYIKFKKVLTYNITSNNITLDDNFIEYAYNANTHLIKRRRLDAEGDETGNPSNWTFYNITEPPFYTRDRNTGVISPLSATGIVSNQNLVVNITGQRVRGALNLNLALREEVKIRNR